MPRGYMPSQHYDDFSLSSLGEARDMGGQEEEEEGEMQHPYPLKSTLPSQYRHSMAQSSRSTRPSLPRTWNEEPAMLQRDFGRGSGGEEDVTLSTDVGTAVDERVDLPTQRGKATMPYEDDSLVPGVGRGHQRTGGGYGASSYSAHRDILAFSHLPTHPSPATAHRHQHMREAAAKAQHIHDRNRLSPFSSVTSDADDSESANESSSTSTSSVLMAHQGMMQSKAESTGNHQAYTVTQQNESPAQARSDRPKLDHRALDEMDKAIKKGKATLQKQMPDSPSPVPSRGGTPRRAREVRSKKEERRGESPSRPTSKQQLRGMNMEAEGSNGSSGYVAGTNARKPSDGSSNGKKQPGTDGSTTGDTLVNEGGRAYLHSAASTMPRGDKSPFMKLPSGQRMGQGLGPESIVHLPDLTGMTSALESPVKTLLGVQHRPVMPEVVQARLMQTNEARVDDFNELAHYVKSVEKNLDQTQRKVQAVEDTSRKCAKEVDALRSEWSSWRGGREKKAVSLDVEEQGSEEEEDEYEDKVQAINDHIAHLTQDLRSYRDTMEQLRAAKAEQDGLRERKLRESQQRQAEKRRLSTQGHHVVLPLSSSPTKATAFEEEEEATRVEMAALRKQVKKVAKEVDRLRNIVEGDDGQVKAAPSAGKSARFASSLPPMRRSIGVGSQNPFPRAKLPGHRSSTYNDSLAAAAAAASQHGSEVDEVQARATSFAPSSQRAFSDDDDDGDETARPMENEEESRAVPEYDQGEHDDDGEVSMAAQSRAEKTFEAVKERRRMVAHDENTCTVCVGKQKTERRRQARRDRVGQQMPLPPSSSSSAAAMAAEDEEHLVLSLLEAATTRDEAAMKPLPKSSKHYQAICRLLKEHLDEFYHHRLLYCELADELKQYEPSMNRVKRRILAEHVMEAVEGLEFRAKRINVLQVMVGGSSRETSDGDHDGHDGHDDHNEDLAPRERRKRRPRNSPPIVDGGDLYRRVVSA